jgi:hypothetical protein
MARPRQNNGELGTALVRNATTVVVSGAGFLGRLVIHTVASSTTIIIYDGITASGTIIYSWVAADGKVDLELNYPFSTGLTIVMSDHATAGVITYGKGAS